MFKKDLVLGSETDNHVANHGNEIACLKLSCFEFSLRHTRCGVLLEWYLDNTPVLRVCKISLK